MNDLSNALTDEENNRHCCSLKPVPALALFVLVPLFLIGLSASIFIWIVVHNVVFFIAVALLSFLVLSFIVWNVVNWRRKEAILIFLDSFPDSDLRVAKDGQLVKITGSATCGSVSLESSYEKVPSCIYTSTCLYEYKRFQSKSPSNPDHACLRWSLAYSERFSTDFYITDAKSGVRAMVKAGYGAKITPLINESTLVNTNSKYRMLSPYLKKWLGERNISVEARLLHLQEGYVKEGSPVTVVGLLHRNNDVFMIVQPPELISTGCLWQKLLLPVEIDGLILRVPESTSSAA